MLRYRVFTLPFASFGFIFALVMMLAIGIERTAVAQEQPRAEPNALAIQELETSATDRDGAVALTRGPLHEAFAEPHNLNPEPSAVVGEEPPATIEEMPPEMRPIGEHVEWIPGYWAWEPADSRFIWISGLWRDIPPGKRWVPGYWEKVDSGNRWIAGFWTDQQTEEVEYLPQPPQSVERGPSVVAPGSNYFYVPGIWVYDGNDYQWRPGYWAPNHDHWVWIPATYRWTPRGCIFRPGYWDLEVFHRGVVFAPIYFSQPIYRRPNYYYSPWAVIDFDVNLFVHLFLSPDRSHYYYGDYYGVRGAGSYYAWSDLHTRHLWYDPLYAYYDSRPSRTNVNFVDWVDHQHQYFVQNAQYRPPTTLRAQIEMATELRRTNEGSLARMVSFGRDVNDLARDPDAGAKLQRVTAEEQRDWRERVKPYRELAENRIRGEVLTSSRDANASVKTRMALPRFEQLPAGQIERDRSERAKQPEPNRGGDRTNRRPETEGDRDAKGSDRPPRTITPRPDDWPPGRRERDDIPPNRPATEPDGADKAVNRRAPKSSTPNVDPRTREPGARREVPKPQPKEQPKAKEQPKSEIPNRTAIPPTTEGQPRRPEQAPPKGEGAQRSYRPRDNANDGVRSPPSSERGAKPEKQQPPKERPRGDQQRGNDKDKDKDKEKDGI